MIVEPAKLWRKFGMFLFCVAAMTNNFSVLATARSEDGPPPIPREFRAVWVATVNNIDWPSKPGLPSAKQQAEIINILDTAVNMHLNAIVLQVRPACDAMYPSALEPWSEYLTGTMGTAPSPNYDPLEFWITEAHKRCIELHAWFNPYRAHHPSAKGPISEEHVSKTKPIITKTYGSHLWLDPGEKGTQDHSLAVIMDVVKRYDIDGVHMDDYFYPYKEKNKDGEIIPFPDDHSYGVYKKAGGNLDKEDWRRSNVDHFVEHLYKEIKRVKPQVRLGISPFGIWRPGNPPQIKGFDQYSELYADARKWIREGWVDYWTPQLYWSIAAPAQSYPVLLQWWSDQNLKHRNLWPGLYTSRTYEGNWSAKEITDQIEVTRKQAGAGGVVHFSMTSIMRNSRGIADALRRSYAEPALVPATPWLGKWKPESPLVQRTRDLSSENVHISWTPRGKDSVWLWVVQAKVGGKWRMQVLPSQKREWEIRPGSLSVEGIYVTAVSSIGLESEAVQAKLGG